MIWHERYPARKRWIKPVSGWRVTRLTHTGVKTNHVTCRVPSLPLNPDEGAASGRSPSCFNTLSCVLRQWTIPALSARSPSASSRTSFRLAPWTNPDQTPLFICFKFRVSTSFGRGQDRLPAR